MVIVFNGGVIDMPDHAMMEEIIYNGDSFVTAGQKHIFSACIFNGCVFDAEYGNAEFLNCKFNGCEVRCRADVASRSCEYNSCLFDQEPENHILCRFHGCKNAPSDVEQKQEQDARIQVVIENGRIVQVTNPSGTTIRAV